MEETFLAPLNLKQSSILRKSKSTVKAFFSKLPCIKTCMSRVEMTTAAAASESSSRGCGGEGGCSSNSTSKPCVTRKESKKIDFERVEDDFNTQSSH